MRQRKQYVKHVGETSFTSYDGKTAVNNIAAAAIETAFTGHYEPTVVSYRGHTLILFRIAQDGWTYRILAPADLPEGTLVTLYPCTYPGNSVPREKVLQGALFHLVQNATDVQNDSLEAIPAPLENVDQHTLAEYRSWLVRQKRYLSAAALLGKENNLTRQLANNDPALKGEERVLLDLIEPKY